jgi:hypothetical protein
VVVDAVSNGEVGAEVSMLLIGADVGKDEGAELSEEASLLVIPARVGGGEETSLLLVGAGVVAIPMTGKLVASMSFHQSESGCASAGGRRAGATFVFTER